MSNLTLKIRPERSALGVKNSTLSTEWHKLNWIQGSK